LFGGMPANSCGVEKDFSTLHRGEARGFGRPLVPANEDADFAVASLPGAKAEVAGGEIKFFVIERVVRNVHLAVKPEKRAVGVNHDGRVVVEAGGALFEEGSDDNGFVVLCKFLKRFGGRAGNGFRKFEVFVVLSLAKVLGAE